MEREEPRLPDVRCIVWLDGGRGFTRRVEQKGSKGKRGSRRMENSESESEEKRDFKMSAALRGLQGTRCARFGDLASKCSPRNAHNHLTRTRSATAGWVARCCGFRVEFHEK